MGYKERTAPDRRKRLTDLSRGDVGVERANVEIPSENVLDIRAEYLVLGIFLLLMRIRQSGREEVRHWKRTASSHATSLAQTESPGSTLFTT